MFCVEREVGSFDGDYQALAGVDAVFIVGVEFLHGFC